MWVPHVALRRDLYKSLICLSILAPLLTTACTSTNHGRLKPTTTDGAAAGRCAPRSVKQYESWRHSSVRPTTQCRGASSPSRRGEPERSLGKAPIQNVYLLRMQRDDDDLQGRRLPIHGQRASVVYPRGVRVPLTTRAGLSHHLSQIITACSALSS